ncbi:hypothetical protein IW510_11335 [Enterococcus sp. BWR-S5]|nr:hypothetical protein [Enterococcus sp. BWR-S5]
MKREAEKMGKDQEVQREADRLVEQLAKGNVNPGKGNKNLFKDVCYLRGANGARVFFRKVDGVIEILGKSHKGNEDKVIKLLMDLYK